MSVGEIWRASVLWQVGGVDAPMVNVFHYRQATIRQQSTDVLDLALALEEDVVPYIADCISAAIECNGVQLRSISDPTIGGDVSYSPTIPGTLSGETYAHQAGPLIHWSTGLIGRHYAGRNYLPPPVESSVGGSGSVAGAYATLLDTAAQAIMNISSSVNHAGYDLIVYSKPGPGGSGWMGAATPVTSYSVRDRLKTQRRRGL